MKKDALSNASYHDNSENKSLILDGIESTFGEQKAGYMGF
jgi:hypothetical protein